MLKYHYHISEADFKTLSLRQLNALVHRYHEEERMKDLRVAAIRCTLVNCFRTRKQPYKIEDFMPKKQQPTAPQTMETQLAMVQAWNAALGGKT